MASILTYFLSTLPGGYFAGRGGQFLRDVSCEIAIFKVPTLQDFDKFWAKKGAKMGTKLRLDFALIFHSILERFWSENRGHERSKNF